MLQVGLNTAAYIAVQAYAIEIVGGKYKPFGKNGHIIKN